MLLARASAELARAIFADAIGGLAASEEIDDQDAPPENGAAPEPTAARRRRAPAVKPATTPPAPPPPSPAPPPLPREREPTPAEPEPPPEPEPEPDPITEQQRKRLMQLFRDRGFQDRDHRLAFTSAMLHRKVESANDLTEPEARRLIDILEAQDDP
jgi:hypothetical protein